jgi:hypothetical protein
MAGVFAYPGYARFWAADAVSTFGTYVTTVALPTLAVLSLKASDAQVGLLNGARWTPPPAPAGATVTDATHHATGTDAKAAARTKSIAIRVPRNGSGPPAPRLAARRSPARRTRRP